MDETAKNKLVDKLSASAKKFDTDLSAGSRRWFVSTIIRTHTSSGDSDEQIAQKTEQLMADTKALVAAAADFTLALQADGNPRFSARAIKKKRTDRVEILYGAIAMQPSLADAAQKDYLLFLAKRRLRSVCRQHFWINPNTQDRATNAGYFFYADRCQADASWRPSESARATYWDVTTAVPNDHQQPYTMKPGVDSIAAFNAFFHTMTQPCRANLFDCMTVADLTFLDALLEATHPKTLLAAMPADFVKVQRFTQLWNSIDKTNPIGKVALPLPKPIDQRQPGDPTVLDLQIGDQAYIFNHPLYKTFRPTGSWRGEWAFVYSCGNRDFRSDKGFFFGGHGKEGTLFKFYQDFVSELGVGIALARQLARVHLAFMTNGAAAIAPGTVLSDTADNVQIKNLATDAYAATPARVLVYDAAAKARDFTKVPTKTRRRPKVSTPGFLVLQSTAADVFFLAQVQGRDPEKALTDNLMKASTDIPADKKINWPIRIERMAEDPANPMPKYAIEKWAIWYHHESKGDQQWPFFEVIDGESKRKELTTDGKTPVGELFDAPFYVAAPGSTDIRVYQPRVDFADHRTWLSQNGGFGP